MGGKNNNNKLSRLWAIYQCLQVGCKLRYEQNFKNHTSPFIKYVKHCDLILNIPMILVNTNVSRK